ncbi:MAG: uroporphyrinogen-III synthase [Gammaproteobacteria bacterium TMED92]|nr:MAG: uroporphyrinogen-III synthase [Gammaproteobacteria bacterium TMED92]
MKQTWVTLTEPSAHRLADALIQADFEPLLAPATTIGFLPWEMPKETPHGLVFLSQHAAAGFLQKLSHEPTQIRTQILSCKGVFAVGKRTAGLLRSGGMNAQTPERENSEGLLALSALIPEQHGGRLRSDDRVWLLSGRGGRNIVFDALGTHCELIRCDVYQRQDAVLAPLDSQAVCAMVVGSIHGLNRATAHWLACGGDRDVIVIAPSQRVQSHAIELGFCRSFNAQGSSTAALLRCLKSNVG